VWFARADEAPFLGRLVAAPRRIEHAAAPDHEALLVVVLDVTAERQAEAATRVHNQQLRSLLDFSTRSFATAIEAGQFALAESLRVTGSRIGVLHLLDDAGGAPAMSAWQRAVPAGQGLVARTAAGLSGVWLQAARDGRPVWSEDPAGSGSLALWPGVGPPGQRLLTVAAGDPARPVAVIGLGDAMAPFSTADADGVQLLMARLRDILDRLAVEARITDQRARSFHADRMRTLGEMATGMAHEINQPLNGIRVFAESLLVGLRRGWPVVQTEWVETLDDIVKLVDRASGTIDHVRALAADRDDQPPVTFALASVTNRAVTLMRGQMHAAGVTVDCGADGDLPLLCGWPGAIEQVVLILLGNARDALAERQQRPRPGPGEWVPQIRVRAATEGSDVVLTVTDNGDGVPDPVAARIFDPFFTTKEVGKGTGLGLAIARSIVERHGGVIQLVPQGGGGAVFRVALPVRGAAG
jgi:signal transduction histidine kinase